MNPPRIKTSASTASEIQNLIREKLLIEIDSPDEDLLAAGVLDSLTLVQLLVNIEERFGVIIPLAELELDDIRSITSIVNLIESGRYAPASDAVLQN